MSLRQSELRFSSSVNTVGAVFFPAVPTISACSPYKKEGCSRVRHHALERSKISWQLLRFIVRIAGAMRWYATVGLPTGSRNMAAAPVRGKAGTIPHRMPIQRNGEKRSFVPMKSGAVCAGWCARLASRALQSSPGSKKSRRASPIKRGRGRTRCQ
jgi:hypothetical protein